MKISISTSIILSLLYSTATCAMSETIKDRFEEDPILPTVVVHGLKNSGSDMAKDVEFIKHVSPYTPVFTPDLPLKGFAPCQASTDMLVYDINNNPALKNGFNLIGYSLGGLIARAAVEQGNLEPRVYTLANLATPQRGVCGFPYAWDDEFDRKVEEKVSDVFKEVDEKCGGILSLISNEIEKRSSCFSCCCNCIHRPCNAVERITYKPMYSSKLQALTSIANIWNEPTEQKAYLQNNIFLPYLNNEKKHKNFDTHIENLASVACFLSLAGDKDTTVEPAESTHWEYPDTKREKIISLTKSTVYKALGLNQMRRQGVFIREMVPATHGSIHQDPKIYTRYILPRLIRTSQAES